MKPKWGTRCNSLKSLGGQLGLGLPGWGFPFLKLFSLELCRR